MKRLMLALFITSGLACAQKELPVAAERSEEDRKNMAMGLLGFLRLAKKESEAESKAGIIGTLLGGAIGFAIPAKLLSTKVLFGTSTSGEAEHYQAVSLLACAAISLTTWFSATKGAEFVTGWWNGSRARGKQCDQASEQIVRVVKGEHVEDDALKLALKNVVDLEKHHGIKFDNYLVQQGIMPDHVDK